MAIKEALIKKLEGDVALSEANLKTFFDLLKLNGN